MLNDKKKDILLELYRKMKLSRRFEEKVVELVNENEIFSTTHEYIGEEAVAAGICTALNDDDYMMSTHRGHGHMVCKGGELKYMFSELMGKENGYNKGKGGSMHIANPEIGILGANGIVGAGVPIACGAALALKMDGSGKIIVSFYGDGAANQGVVHEAMNMAAIWSLPILFVCENNQYAVSTSVNYSSKIKDLSQRAKSYGFPGITVDGMNAVKVYEKALKICDYIRKGNGPYLLECKTYRYHGHFTAEPMLGIKYRDDEEIKRYKSLDPIDKLKKFLLDEKISKNEEIEEIDKKIEKQIQEAVYFAKKSKFPEAEDALNGMYATEYKNIPRKGW
ncbi:thiamine pyrophosphate-dependent dehydrogenase E1 component subunit alpha [Actinomycetota bacterium]